LLDVAQPVFGLDELLRQPEAAEKIKRQETHHAHRSTRQTHPSFRSEARAAMRRGRRPQRDRLNGREIFHRGPIFCQCRETTLLPLHIR